MNLADPVYSPHRPFCMILEEDICKEKFKYLLMLQYCCISSATRYETFWILMQQSRQLNVLWRQSCQLLRNLNQSSNFYAHIPHIKVEKHELNSILLSPFSQLNFIYHICILHLGIVDVTLLFTFICSWIFLVERKHTTSLRILSQMNTHILLLRVLCLCTSFYIQQWPFIHCNSSFIFKLFFLLVGFCLIYNPF